MTASALAVRPEASSLLKADGNRYSWLEIVRSAGNGVRETMMMNGTAPTLESLAGWEFAGANSLILTRLIGIRKFVKGFYQGADRDQGPSPHIQGYNITVRQNADDAPHLYTPSAEKPKRHGYYRVHRVIEGAKDARYPTSLLLDYALGGNGALGPPLRDYIVQVYPDDPDLLLGKAYVALGPIRIPVSFFVLKRLQKHAHTG